MRPEELHAVRIKRELDDMLQKNALNKRRLLEMMDDLSTMAVDTELLQRTQIGRTINNVRKAFVSSKDISQKSAKLIKQWKQLVKTEHTRKKSVSSTHSDEGIKSPGFVGSDGPISSPESSTVTGDDNEREQQFSPVLDNERDDHAYFHFTAATDGSKSGRRSPDVRRPAKVNRSNSLTSTSSSTDTSDNGDGSSGNGSSKTLDKTRMKSVELLRKALLSGDEPPPTGHQGGKTSLDLAMDIERHIYEEIGNADDRHYKARIRSRVTNFRDKKNGTLRNDILTGRLPAKRVATMSVDELANDQMKRLRRSIEEESLRSREISDDVSSSRTDLYPCEQCGQRDAMYSVNQERVEGDYEPIAITQIVCNKCGHRWRAF